MEIVENGKIDLSKTNILVVDDINLIKKNKQLDNLEKVLAMLPSEKQNIVYTNRRSRETQEVLEKILQAPEEIKVDKAKEQEAEITAHTAKAKPENGNKNNNKMQPAILDKEAVELSKKCNSFAGRTPAFILVKGIIVENEEK